MEGSAAASLGTIGFKADAAMEGAKDPTIADRPKSDPIITTCSLGGQVRGICNLFPTATLENFRTPSLTVNSTARSVFMRSPPHPTPRISLPRAPGCGWRRDSQGLWV